MGPAAENDRPPELNGARVTLRGPRKKDALDRQCYGVNADLSRMVGVALPGDLAMDEQMADRWYRGLVVRSGPLDWVIEFEGRCIGTACLHSVDDKDRRAAFAIAIFDPDCVGRGLGTEATNLALGHAFDTLGLHRVSVRVLAYNERAIACYQKCGFTIEGRERESARVGDDWHDDLIMGVLSHEWAVSRGEEPRR